MVYPITERTYFSNQQIAWAFAERIATLNHHIVSDFGYEAGNDEPYFVETMNDPFSTKSELLRKAGVLN